jgi:hypothetical protein
MRALQIRILRTRAEFVAANIRVFIEEIKSQVGLTMQPSPPGTIEQRRFDALRLLRHGWLLSHSLQGTGRQRYVDGIGALCFKRCFVSN